ncbi:hypothetical protein M5G27_07345 [Pseudomonas shahriarae]|uniref:Uncharacterized protein n=1 Tax=Pseudomonas shahriarae TaxID=2745512 RepID=A0A9X4BZJ7_9PSED|nr:hypothetical protein [Pseudomonas shahriarae]MDD1007295.1 hypothetical protein [Pseudomonas shahriarae]
MTSKRIKLLVWTLIGAALATVVKMFVTDEWAVIRPFLTGLWDWLGSVGAWFSRPVSFPLWAFMLAILIVTCVIGVLAFAALVVRQDLRDVEAKLNPSLPVLTESAHKVLAVIARNSGASKELHMSELPKLTGLPDLLFAAGMDVLDNEGMFEIYPSSWGNRIDLSARGRAYILHPKSPLHWIVSSL